MTALRPACLAFLLAGTTAHAEITPDELWALWQEQSTLKAASRRSEDGVLILDGVSARFGPSDEPTTLLVEQVRMTPEDGAVRVAMSETARLDGAGPERSNVRTEGMIRQSGLDILASGTPESPRYTIQADSLAIEAEDLPTEDGTSASIEIAIDGLDGRATLGDDHLDGEVEAGNLSMTLASEAPEPDGETFDVTARYVDYTMSVLGDPRALSGFDPFASSNASADFEIANSLSSSSVSASFDGTDGTLDATFGTGGSAGELSFTEGRFAGETSVEDMRFTLTGSLLPVEEVGGALRSGRTAFSIPSLPAEDPQPLSLDVALDGVTLSDRVWNLFDPDARLPRDPASLSLSWDANARIDAPLSPQAEDLYSPTAPLRFLDVTLKELSLSMLGAALDAAGQVDFDADAPGSEPFAAPDGRIDVTLKGASQLLTTLGELRLLPEGMALGARMALGTFFTNGEGEDVLESTITLDPSGAISINGQRMR